MKGPLTIWGEEDGSVVIAEKAEAGAPCLVIDRGQMLSFVTYVLHHARFGDGTWDDAVDTLRGNFCLLRDDKKIGVIPDTTGDRR